MEVIPAPFVVRLSDQAREPDLFFVRRERLDLLRDTYFDGGPDLVVAGSSALELYPASGSRRSGFGRPPSLRPRLCSKKYWAAELQQR